MRRSILVGFGLLLALVVVNVNVNRFEHILSTGTPVLLPLAPVDPRSLMQGDYMQLRFALADDISALLDKEDGSSPGAAYAILRLDDRGVGHLQRLQVAPEPVGSGEMAVRFSVRDGRVKLLTDAFFFEEGKAEHFAAARFGQVRIDGNGTAILAALHDANLAPL